MVRLFQETFWVVLGMSLLPLGSASLRFAEGELIWRTYTAAEALSVTKWVELFRVKEFVAAALGANDGAFVAQLRRPRIFILLAKQNCLVQRQSPRHDSRITPSSFAAELPKHVGIKNYPIGQVDDLPSHPLALRTWFIRKMDGSFRLCV